MILTALAMISGSTVGFYVLALVAIFASLRVIMHTNPVHALLSMIVSLLSVAGIFFSLGAPFAGALEIIVYAGAILVLFVFVVMMLNLGTQNELQEKNWLDAKAWAVPMGLSAIVGLAIMAMIGMNHGAGADVSVQALNAVQNHTQTLADGTTVTTETVTHTTNTTALATIGGATVGAKAVGTKLFTEYLLLVEVAGFLLLGALVAAYHLAKRSLSDENVEHDTLLNPADNLHNKLPNLANEGVIPSNFDNQGEVIQALQQVQKERV